MQQTALQKWRSAFWNTGSPADLRIYSSSRSETFKY